MKCDKCPKKIENDKFVKMQEGFCKYDILCDDCFIHLALHQKKIKKNTLWYEIQRLEIQKSLALERYYDKKFFNIFKNAFKK